MQFRVMQKKGSLLPAVMLPVLLLSLNGCAPTSAPRSPDSSQVAVIPALAPSARQGPAIDACLPSCSEKLIQRRESMRQRLTAGEKRD